MCVRRIIYFNACSCQFFQADTHHYPLALQESLGMKNGKLLEITNSIYIIRDQKVMLDRDLALLYGVEVKRLNEQVKRKLSRI